MELVLSKVVKDPPFPSQVGEFWTGDEYTTGGIEGRKEGSGKPPQYCPTRP